MTRMFSALVALLFAAAASAQSINTSASATLSYLQGLATGSSHRVLTGQHANIWNSDLSSQAQTLANVSPLQSQTGQLPAILGVVLNDAINSYAYQVSVANADVAQWYKAGGLAALTLYSNMPTTGNGGAQPQSSSIDAGTFHAIATPGTTQYNNWHAQLDSYVPQLQALTANGAILWRPLTEVNGNWNWYGAQNPADFIAIWKDMHDYLTITKGVKNLLWVYNVNIGVGNYTAYYPGASYVDIVSLDCYVDNGSSSNVAPFVAAATMGNAYGSLVAIGKPFIFFETGLGLNQNGVVVYPGNNTQDVTVILSAIKQSLPATVGFLVFEQSYSITYQNNAKTLMNDPWVVNLGQLPQINNPPPPPPNVIHLTPAQLQAISAGGLSIVSP